MGLWWPAVRGQGLLDSPVLVGRGDLGLHLAPVLVTGQRSRAALHTFPRLLGTRNRDTERRTWPQSDLFQLQDRAPGIRGTPLLLGRPALRLPGTPCLARPGSPPGPVRREPLPPSSCLGCGSPIHRCLCALRSVRQSAISKTPGPKPRGRCRGVILNTERHGR